MAGFTFRAADVGWTMNWNVTENAAALNLTGATITLRVTGQAARTCEIVSAAGGTCRYKTIASDFAAGIYVAVLRIVLGADTVHTEAFNITAETSP